MTKYTKIEVFDAIQWHKPGDIPGVRVHIMLSRGVRCPYCTKIADHGEIDTIGGEIIICPED